MRNSSLSIIRGVSDIFRDIVKAPWFEGWIERLWAIWYISVVSFTHVLIVTNTSESSPIIRESLRGCIWQRRRAGGWCDYLCLSKFPVFRMVTRRAVIKCPRTLEDREITAMTRHVIIDKRTSAVMTNIWTRWTFRASCSSPYSARESTKVTIMWAVPSSLQQLILCNDFRLVHHCRVDCFRNVWVCCLLIFI